MTTEHKTLSQGALAALDAKLASQIGDDVSVIFNHEALFKESRRALAHLQSEVARLSHALAAERTLADVSDLAEAIRPQISEGMGAILRKFCDSHEAMKARSALHAMPDRDWNCLVDMLTQASAEAAHAARRKE